ncbi:MAG: hypothetical protein KJO41_05755 [Bacteroidia bacterium]|nr:hypothetical protein [Bacteroidia bacterium]NND26366.1 hypothetical protein [Flavobacteriaceae bacterium]MBT8278488.1 hypothetical protein [Bacteroidia bacterium]NNK60231.1 hypothetical protein [Flavobacteriaceae bacterium]NNL31694.1 hypothetical protein [Flavobacteriaceae bacterium]
MPTNISINIEHAIYGIKEKCMDVTAQTQAALAGDDITISPKKLGIEDPAPGEIKHFAVKAMITIDNKEPYPFYYIAKDYETIDFIP